MKRNVVAILLSISLIMGAFGAAPLHAAEVLSQEEMTESEQDAEGLTSEGEQPVKEGAEAAEEAAADSTSQSTYEQAAENEPVDEEKQDDHIQFEETNGGSTGELTEIENAEEGLSDEGAAVEDATAEESKAEEATVEEATAEEAGNAATVVDKEIAAVVEPTVESTDGKDAALAGGTGDVVASGYCGYPNYSAVKWTVTGTGNDLTLTISGKGNMDSYLVSEAPWYDYCWRIRNVVIKDGITVVGEAAFYDCKMESISIPDSVTIIYDLAFTNCSNLTSITIPDGIDQIGYGEFMGCASLTDITIPDSVTVLSSRAFSGCSSLTNITIPDSMTKIYTETFKDCSSLTSITIPDGVTAFDNEVFAGCSSLTSFIIPDGVKQVSTSLFSGCSSLADITIPDSVTSIADDAFSGCSSLTNITIPDGVTRIGKNAFSGCSNLAGITLPENITSIGKETFSDCTSLEDIIIPGGVTSVEEAAFRNCSNLSSVTFMDGVTSIGKSAFDNCGNLASIIIPDSVTQIDDNNTWGYDDQKIDVYTVKGCKADEYFALKNESDNTVFDIHYLYDPKTEHYSSVYPKSKCIVLKNGDVVNADDYLIITDDSYSDSIEITVDDESILIFDRGQFAALAEGTTSITVTCNEERITIPVKVVEETAKITKIAFDESAFTMQNGDTANLLLNFTPGNAVPVPADWSSSDPDVVSVDQNGLVKALASGSAAITANVGGLTATCEITVVKNSKAIVAFDEVMIERGNSEKLFFYVFPTGSADAEQFSFESEDSDIVEVTDDGIITAKTLGTANVYVKCGEMTKTISVTVQAKLKDISLNQTSGRLHKDETLQLEVIYDPEDTTDDRTVQWTSSNESAAVVDENGLVTACGKGITTISAKVGDQTVKCTIVCMSIPLTGIELPEELIIEYGKNAASELTYTPDNTTDDKIVTWESSDPDIFTVVQDGTITPTGIGTATLTATVRGYSATSEITVVKGTPEYKAPEQIDARCGQKLEELDLPEGFEWDTPEDNVGNAGTNQHEVTYVPVDSDHYNTVGDITVVVIVEHDFSKEWTQSPDSHWHECVCGEKTDEESHAGFSRVIEPTCTQGGFTMHYCSRCGYYYEDDETKAKGHSFNSWTVTREATCTETGEMKRTCAVCDETEVVEFGARGHVWLKNYTVDQAATCTVAGSESIHCAACDAVNESSVREIPATGHALTHVEAVLATNESEGNIEYYSCGTCGKLFKDDVCAQEITAEETVIPRMEEGAVAIVSHPADVEVMAGDAASFRVIAQGDNLSYRWQWSTDGNTWKNSTAAGYNTDTFSFKMSAKYAGRYYRCKVTNGINTVYSKGGLLSIANTIQIISEPTDLSVKAGDNAVFTVKATGNNLSYQWQWSKDGITWKNSTAAGYNTDTFSFKMSAKYAGRYYRCKVTDGTQTVYSKGGLLSLAESIQIISEPEDVSVSAGDNAVFTVEATGNNLSYQWQWSKDEITWKNSTAAGYDTDTFSFTMNAKYAGRYYRCKITNGTNTVYTRGGFLSVLD